MSVSRHAVTAAVSLAAGLFIGQAVARGEPEAGQPATPDKPAFLVASARAIHPQKMGPYQAAAGPLAMAAGLQILATGDPTVHLLEGSWTQPTTLTVERYRSMAELKAFWHSSGYQEARKLREGLLDVHFIVALEGH